MVKAQEREVEAARGSLTAAKANLANPAVRSAAAAAVRGQILQARDVRGYAFALDRPGPAHAVLRQPTPDALSGGFTPIEAMPKWIQPFSLPNPIAHFATLARSVMVRGAGLEVVYVQLFALGLIAALLVGFSASRFRSQMS